MQYRRGLEAVVGHRRRQVRPFQRVGAFPGLLRRRRPAADALHHDIKEQQLRQSHADRAERGDLVPGLEHQRIVRDAPRHAGEAEEVLHEENHVEEDHGQPEMNLAERLVVHLAGPFRQPEVDAGERREQRPGHHHVVEVRHHVVGVLQLDVDRHDRQHQAGEAPEGEHEQEAHREQHRRLEGERPLPHRRHPVEHLHARGHRDQHRRVHEEQLAGHRHARRVHVVRPHDERDDRDRRGGVHHRGVAEQRLSGERRDHLGDDAEGGQRDDVHLGVAEEPEDVLVEHRVAAAGGGDPVLYQHIFWFFGHPEVYVVALPAFGVISQVIPAFSRKPLFGYASMVYATAAIAIISFIVWAHHMYTTGMPVTGQLFFMYATMLVAVPTGVKVFNWVATMWKGSLSFETPMLFAMGFLFMFTLGGFTGLVLSIVPVDIQLQDTYYVVAHFHYVMVAGALFAAFAGLYFWLPKWTGRMYDETLGKIHFWLTLIFFNMIFFVQHFLGLAGMPRRIPDYPLMFETWNKISSLGAFGMGLAQLLFLYIVVKCIRSGAPAPQKPWEGADSLEWTHLPTPVPYHSFETPPVLK